MWIEMFEFRRVARKERQLVLQSHKISDREFVFRFKRKSRASDSSLRLSTRVGAGYWSLMVGTMGSRLGEKVVVCVKNETV